MKKLFVSSTKQGDGNTMVSLGLLKAFSERTKKIGFMKPLGLSELMLPGYSIDYDASLMERVFNLHANIRDMNPVTLDKDSLESLAEPGRQDEVLGEIVESFKKVSGGRDIVLVKGNVGASCGRVYGLSNALIAKTLGAKVLILTSGGVGHPLDEVALNLEYYQSKGVEVVGVVFNKVFPQEEDKLRGFGAKFLEEANTRLLGIIPYNKLLAMPTIRDLTERVRGRIIAGEQHVDNHIGRIFIGAMAADQAAKYFEENCLLITGGDRADMIVAAHAYSMLPGDQKIKFGGLILTGGVTPPEEILELLRRADMPVIVVDEDSYTVASKVSQMQPRISPANKQKIEIVSEMVRRHVEVDKLFELL